MKKLERRYIVEIKRNKNIEPELFKKLLTELLSNHRNVYGSISFEVFRNMEDREFEMTSPYHNPILRCITVYAKNTIPGTKIVDFDIDAELDLYYASVLVAHDIMFNADGIFIPRLIHDKEYKECKLICLDYIMKWGDKICDIRLKS